MVPKKNLNCISKYTINPLSETNIITTKTPHVNILFKIINLHGSITFRKI
ncbi:MAG: hypothetical protein ACI8ZF_000261 [Candidatus Midichloriaceae bacterium]|jgi:hypothetical protein